MLKFAHNLVAKYLYPDRAYENIKDIDLGALQADGIKGLIVDLDNTLVAPRAKKQDGRMHDWIETARDAGFDICLLSNATRRRVTRLTSGLGIYAIAGAGKPSRAGFIKAMRLMKLGPPQVCVIGDQIFTDILGARRLKIMALHIRPITKREELTVTIKRLAEYFVIKKYRNTT